MANSKVLIIWGMHRSGTSMIASWLAACGLDVGRDLLGAGLGNENGHYEDTEFLGLHERILNDNCISCGGILQVGPLEVSKQHISEIKEILNSRLEQKVQWGWKEPRTCLLYKEYIDLLPGAFHFVVFRDYKLVVDSLVRRKVSKFERRNSKRNGFKAQYYRLGIFLWRKFLMHGAAEKYLKAWIKYNENLLELSGNVSEGNVFVMNCSNFIGVDKKAFSWLMRSGFKLTYIGAEECATPGMMASSSDQRYRFSDSSLLLANAVQARLEKLAVHSKESC